MQKLAQALEIELARAKQQLREATGKLSLLCAYPCCQGTHKVQILQKLEGFTACNAAHKVTNALDVALARRHAGSCLSNGCLQILLALKLQLIGLGNGHHHFQFSRRLQNTMVA